MYGNPAFDCSGAQVHAVCRQLATVVTVDGVVDDTNIERVAALALRFVIAEKPFVLDLSNVSSFSAHSVSLLSRSRRAVLQQRRRVDARRKRHGAARTTGRRAELPGGRFGARRAALFRRLHHRTSLLATDPDQKDCVAKGVPGATRHSLARIPAWPSARAGQARSARRLIAAESTRPTLGYALDRRRHERDRIAPRRLVA